VLKNPGHEFLRDLGIFGQELCDVFAARQIPEQEIHVNVRALEQAAKNRGEFRRQSPGDKSSVFLNFAVGKPRPSGL
jgi:hypothetical protein